MLIVKFNTTFRERFPEWVTSAVMFMWGAVLLSSPLELESSSFDFISRIAPQEAWGYAAAIAGFARLVGLYINGHMKQTPYIRMCGAVLGVLVWFGVFVGIMASHIATPSWCIYLGLATLDCSALYFATYDASKIRKRTK